MSYSREFQLKLYRDLIHCRKIEEKMIEMYAAGKFPGHIHSGFGEEAVFTGACATMNPQDWMKQTHRSISSTYLKGVTTREILADCMGKKTGTSRGIGGVNHITSREHGLIGLSGSLGCDISIAAGVALALKREGKGGVSYAFFGDGAQNRGPFHEAANLAAVWKLPMIFVCDNNQFAITTPIETTLPVANIADRAAAYGMPSRIADGNDVFDVYEKVSEMMEYVRAGNGPAFVECKTYRMRGHFEGDQVAYRSREVTDEWARKDCVERMERRLKEEGVLTDELIAQIRAEIDQELDEAERFAEESPEPTVDEIYDGLYA